MQVTVGMRPKGRELAIRRQRPLRWGCVWVWGSPLRIWALQESGLVTKGPRFKTAKEEGEEEEEGEETVAAWLPFWW